MNKIRIFLLFATVSTLLMVGCRKDDVKTVSRMFNATVESPDDDSKTHLVNERWVFWDNGDEISVGSSSTNQEADSYHTGEGQARKGVLMMGSGAQQGSFQVEGIPDEAYYGAFLSLYPYNEKNYIQYSSNTFTANIFFPALQAYQNDFSFGHASCPMVGYTDDIDIEFHSLCGIARLELFSDINTQVAKSDPLTVQSIEFVETAGHQISGLLQVKDFATSDPYVYVQSTSATEDNSKITIDCSSAGLVLGDGEGLKSFYLTLPAYQGTTNYSLEMTVKFSGNRSFHKSFSAKVRRNTITKIPALNVKESDLTISIGIVGNGTELRPFQIYNYKDLDRVRQAFAYAKTNSTTPIINGQSVTASTYFQIMSQITLDEKKWTEGIQDFVGHIVHKSANPIITNNSKHPLFESIAQGGVVEGITMAGTMESANDHLAMLCGTNKGSILRCNTAAGASVKCTSNTAAAEGCCAAGICYDNQGTINGCISSAVLNALSSSENSHTTAGIAFQNSGTIENCRMSSPGQLQGTKSLGAGICYKNVSGGIVKNCYCTFNVTANTDIHIAGIVYKNLGTVEGCYLSNGFTLSTHGRFGGIVHTNNGVVDYCHNSAAAIQTKGLTGGIVASNAGIVANCWCDPHTNIAVTGANLAGGLVGEMLGGSLYNSYSRAAMSGSNSSVAFAIGKMDGGWVDNCYCTNGTNTTAAIFYAQYISGEIGTKVDQCFAYNWGSASITNVNVKAYSSGGSINDIDDLLQNKAGELNGTFYNLTTKCHTWNTTDNLYPTLTSTDAPVPTKARTHRRSSRR